MDNQKPVLQIQPKQNVRYEYMIAISSGLIIPFVKINTYYSLSNLTIFVEQFQGFGTSKTLILKNLIKTELEIFK